MADHLMFFTLGVGFGVIGMYLCWYIQWLGYSRHRNVPVDDIWDWAREPKNERTFCAEMVDLIAGGNQVMVTALQSRWCKGKLVSTETVLRLQDTQPEERDEAAA
jgi:hypothetical protein